MPHCISEAYLMGILTTETALGGKHCSAMVTEHVGDAFPML